MLSWLGILAVKHRKEPIVSEGKIPAAMLAGKER